MAKSYYPCAECGTDVAVIGRNRSDADRLAKWHQKNGSICQACAAANTAAANAAAAEQNQAAGLPALAGTEKQIGWAEKIRATIVADLAAIRPLVEITLTAMQQGEEAYEDARLKVVQALKSLDNRARNLFGHWTADLVEEVTTMDRFDSFAALVAQQAKASWWIDNRDTTLSNLARALRDNIDAAIMTETIPQIDAEIVAAAEAESIICPAGEPMCSTVVEIRHVANAIEVHFPEKRDDFRDLIKLAGFSWNNKCWARALDFRAGEPTDRVAELGHRLVGAGFIVSIHDVEAKAKASTGDFIPEQTRWITKGAITPYAGWCKITWRKPDDLYDAASSLPGSRYKDGAVYVPPGAIEAVAEFAKKYGFAMSDTPLAMLVAHREALQQGAVVTHIKDAPAAIHSDATNKPEKLDAAPTEIANDFLDND